MPLGLLGLKVGMTQVFDDKGQAVPVTVLQLGPCPALQVGDKLVAAEVFKDIPRVDVIGTSKGRGTTGVIKRHNFGGLRHSHGVKKGERQRGSISSNASNRGSGRPKKGIRMAGRL